MWFTTETQGMLEMQNFTPAYMNGWTDVRTSVCRILPLEPPLVSRVLLVFLTYESGRNSMALPAKLNLFSFTRYVIIVHWIISYATLGYPS